MLHECKRFAQGIFRRENYEKANVHPPGSLAHRTVINIWRSKIGNHYYELRKRKRRVCQSSGLFTPSRWIRFFEQPPDINSTTPIVTASRVSRRALVSYRGELEILLPLSYRLELTARSLIRDLSRSVFLSDLWLSILRWKCRLRNILS